MFDIKTLLNNYESIKENSLFGRYIHFNLIERSLKKNNAFQIGTSELNVPINAIKIGSGSKRVLIWSQMHGNESTGTKAVFDLLNHLKDSNGTGVKDILKGCSLFIIPMLNPDGAKAYTRVNSNNIDLNRDAVDLKAKESKVLRKQLDSFKPHFCFNLHDQRTIFGVENTSNSAILSFLAPSEEETRSLTEGRKQTMNIISAIFQELKKVLPDKIGRYTDEFYPKATGDNFQKMGYNTILVESGHYPNDYDREITRKYTFLSMIKGLHHIATHDDFNSEEQYFSIPNIEKSFCDVVHRYPKKSDVAFQLKEVLENNQIKFLPKSVKDVDIASLNYHKEIVFVD